jgi:hypothetical protein
VLHANDAQTVIGKGLSAGERAITSPLRNPVQGMALNALDSGTASR